MKTYLPTAMALALAVTTTSSLAGDFQLGAAIVNMQSVIAQKENENEFAPIINYQGENFSVMNGTLAYKLYQSDGLLLRFIGEGRSEGYKASDSGALTGMTDRDEAFDAGLQLAGGGDWGVLQLQLVTDITGTHKGSETSIAYLHPWQQGRWMFEPSIGFKAQSKELVNYYYGVRASEATATREAYDADSTVNTFAEFAVAYKMNRKWNIVGGMEYVSLGDEITASPIVDKDYRLTAFSAMIYSF